MKNLQWFSRLLLSLSLAVSMCGISVCAAQTEYGTYEEGETVSYGDTDFDAVEDLSDGDSSSAEETSAAVPVTFSYSIYTDAATGTVYTQTNSGDFVEVSAASYLNSLASGDTQTSIAILNAQSSSFYWDGSYLTKASGINYGPNGKETYYNLDMTPVLNTLQANGYEGIYWTRSDGVRMYGVYVLCAASSSTYPFGTVIETSLGTGLIADNGCGAGIIDIATSW